MRCPTGAVRAGQCRHNSLGTAANGWAPVPVRTATRLDPLVNVKHPNAYAQILDGANLPVAGFEPDAENRHT